VKTTTWIVLGALVAAAPMRVDARSGGTPATATTPELDDLIGCYAARTGGAAQIRVTKHDGRYFLNAGPKWDQESEAKPPTDENLQKLFKDQRHLYVAGLHAGHLGIFKVRPGIIVNNRSVSPDYVMVFITERDVGYRVDCPP
jgi:hypothetical protein